MRGVKAVHDIYDAETGEVVIEAGKKLNARAVRQLAERVKAIAVPDDALYGRYLAEDVVNMQTGDDLGGGWRRTRQPSVWTSCAAAVSKNFPFSTSTM